MQEGSNTQRSELLELDALKMCGYQRKTNQRQVNAIVRAFDMMKLGYLTVSFRDGEYYLVDGAHRVAALKLLGYKWARCLILEGLTYEGEAAFFRGQNTNRRAISQIDRFNSSVEAGDEMSVKIREVVVKNGFKIGAYGKGFDVIKAIITMETIFTVFGYDVMDVALRWLRGAWEGEVRATRKEFLLGVAEFAKRYPDADFVKRMKKVSIDRVWQSYCGFAGRHYSHTSDDPVIRNAMCRALVDYYNEGLYVNNKKRLKWVEEL
jgi:hypothetical protein